MDSDCNWSIDISLPEGDQKWKLLRNMKEIWRKNDDLLLILSFTGNAGNAKTSDFGGVFTLFCNITPLVCIFWLRWRLQTF